MGCDYKRFASMSPEQIADYQRCVTASHIALAVVSVIGMVAATFSVVLAIVFT